MKKILFATTALVATASVAAADITFSGYGRFGVAYTSGTTTAAVVGTPAGATYAADLAALTAANAAVVPLTAATATAQLAVNAAATAPALVAAETALATAAAAEATAVAAAATAATTEAASRAVAGTAAVAAVSATTLSSRFRMTIDGTAESDGGLSFGARVRIEQNNGGTGTGINGARFNVSTGGLTVAVGNIYGAFDSLPGLYSGSVGMTGLGWGNVVTGFASHGYSSTGLGAVDGVEIIYSADAFTVHLSHASDRTEVAASFSFGDWTVGAGFADGGVAATDWILTVGGNIGSVSLGLAVAEVVAGTNATLSAGFSVGSATSINVYVADMAGTSNYGLGVVHSLGGGTSIRGGVASLGGTTRADLGLVFNF